MQFFNIGQKFVKTNPERNKIRIFHNNDSRIDGDLSVFLFLEY